MNINELVELYLSRGFKKGESSHKNKVKGILDSYLDFLHVEFKGYDEVVSPVNIRGEQVKKDVSKFIIEKFKGAPKKDEALKTIKSFWAYLAKENYFGLDPLEGMPDSVALSDEERLLKLVRLIQSRPMNIEELKEALLFGERTIREDIRALREGSGKGLWRYLKLDEFCTRQKEVWYSCSIHPIFLAFNLTVLAELMVGIREILDSNFPHKKPFEILQGQIWPQLTDYAKERIGRLHIELPDDNTRPGKAIDFIDEDGFLRDNISGTLIFSLKTEETVTIFFEQEGSLIKKDVYVIREGFRDHNYRFRTIGDNLEFEIPLEAIQKVERNGRA